jgi:hypothetical protein
MPGNRFKDSLPIIGGTSGSGSTLAVCAMGPVAAGDQVLSMQVWVYQQVGQKVAAASGEGGVHLTGSSPPITPKEKLPFTQSKGWMIQTELEKASTQFTKAKPALATAMAVVKHRNGKKDIEHWSQAVTIEP